MYLKHRVKISDEKRYNSITTGNPVTNMIWQWWKNYRHMATNYLLHINKYRKTTM